LNEDVSEILSTISEEELMAPFLKWRNDSKKSSTIKAIVSDENDSGCPTMG
jgi:hypothetical protein